MTYPININIPNANDYPGDDQPIMQANFANISNYLSVDHVPAGAPSNGLHKQVTFNANNVPSTSPALPVLFTNAVAGVNELFFYSGPAASVANQYVNATSGSTMLMGGMILKWGFSGSIGSPIAFAAAFPNACYSVVVTGSSTLYTGGFVVSAISRTTFTVTRTSGSGSTGFYYIALGY